MQKAAFPYAAFFLQSEVRSRQLAARSGQFAVGSQQLDYLAP
jgi:hypothetical protein